MIKSAGLVLLAVAAVLVWFLMEPSTPGSVSSSGYASLIAAALADNKSNEDLAESAPQQQVTTGWVARDLLTIQAKQGDDLLELVRVRDDRIPALLLIAVLAICWHGLDLTSRRSSKIQAPDAGTHGPTGGESEVATTDQQMEPNGTQT